MHDAFEKLQRLDLKGKNDREIVRVLVECCGREKVFNPFYSELAAQLCSHNRQFRTTFQFAFWDSFKLFAEGYDDDSATIGSDGKRKANSNNSIITRKAINLARLFCHLVITFHLSLSSLKPVDMTELAAPMILFLATLFFALFSSKVFFV